MTPESDASYAYAAPFFGARRGLPIHVRVCAAGAVAVFIAAVDCRDRRPAPRCFTLSGVLVMARTRCSSG
jgi:hypothetical protein